MIKTISQGPNYKAIDIGSFDQLSAHSFIHPKLGHIIEKKLFIGEILNTTGSEVSFMELPSKTTISFLHKHNKHEEVYIFLKGKGQYQIDSEVFDIKEGTIIRVSPEGSRTLCNNSDDKLLYMVIQSAENTLNGYDVSDGYRVAGDIKL